MHVAIIGNGITGVTAARHLRKADPNVRITILSAESKHHWSRPALMYVYMGHMRYQDTKPYEDHFWRRNRIDLVQGWVTDIDTAARTLTVDGRTTLRWDRLLLATGSIPNTFGWPGQDLDRVNGMYSLQDLAALQRWTPRIRHGAVVGGGLIGVELAEMLHARGRTCSLLVREPSYWTNVLPMAESQLVNQVIQRAGIDLRLGTELAEIHDDGRGGVGGLTTTDGERLDVQYVGLTAGVRPNTAVCRGTDIATDRGILVDDQLRTNVDGVFAAGDCAEIVTPEGQRNRVTAVWYTGRQMGEVAAANLLGGAVDYDPGIWFNSAKFFDLEYQVYGEVPSASRPGDDPPDSLYWEHEDGRHAVRICHRDGTVVGFNLMGIRYRHDVCERWIAEGRSLDFVLAHLAEANFDPELYRRYEPAIRAAQA